MFSSHIRSSNMIMFMVTLDHYGYVPGYRSGSASLSTFSHYYRYNLMFFPPKIVHLSGSEGEPSKVGLLLFVIELYSGKKLIVKPSNTSGFSADMAGSTARPSFSTAVSRLLPCRPCPRLHPGRPMVAWSGNIFYHYAVGL